MFDVKDANGFVIEPGDNVKTLVPCPDGPAAGAVGGVVEIEEDAHFAPEDRFVYVIVGDDTFPYYGEELEVLPKWASRPSIPALRVIGAGPRPTQISKPSSTFCIGRTSTATIFAQAAGAGVTNR